VSGKPDPQTETGLRVLVRKRRFWWTACYADEVLATIDTPTYFRSRTREGAISKVVRAFGPRPSPWEEVVVSSRAASPAGGR